MKMLYKTTKIELLRMFRNKYFVVFSIIMPFVFYALYTSSISGSTAIEGTEWKAYFLISMTCFSLMSSSVTTMGIQLLHDRLQPWMNWIQSLPIKRWEYFMARFLSLMVLNGLIIVLLFAVAANWKNIELSLLSWVKIGAWVWGAIIPFLALGTWVSVFKTTETAAGFANLTTLGLALMGGLWMPLNQMPVLVQMIGEWTPGHLYAHGAWALLAGETISFATIGLLVLYFALFLSGSLLTHRYLQKE